MNLEELTKISQELRIKILKSSSRDKIPHLGSCLSCIDILTALYWREVNINPKNPYSELRDRVILSKGHAAPALFHVLALKGFIEKNAIDEFGKDGSYFHEHPPKPGIIPGVEAATGSLGHGLPISLGIAKSGKIKNNKFRVYTIIGDGECNEGSIWEAALLAPKLKLNNLTVFVDYNKWQATGRSNEITNLEPLKGKWDAFGWHVQEIDGHNFMQITKSLNKSKLETEKPSIIIANTIKGKGVSFMQDDNNWHYKTPNELELSDAIQEISLKQ